MNAKKIAGVSQNDLLKIDSQFCFALYSSSRLLTQIYQKLLKPFGLTYTQYVVLLALFEHRELSVKRLGELVLLDSGTLSPLLKKLEGKSLVKRIADPQDDRGVKVQLTVRGEKLRAKLPCVGLQVAETLGQEIAISRLVLMREELKRLVRILAAELAES